MPLGFRFSQWGTDSGGYYYRICTMASGNETIRSKIATLFSHRNRHPDNETIASLISSFKTQFGAANLSQAAFLSRWTELGSGPQGTFEHRLDRLLAAVGSAGQPRQEHLRKRPFETFVR